MEDPRVKTVEKLLDDEETRIPAVKLEYEAYMKALKGGKLVTSQ